VNAHRLAEERSLALHREIAAILERDPSRIADARARVRRWQAEDAVSASYADEWARLLSGPLEELRGVLVDPGEHARALRQSTPFAGYVDPRRRWRIWREVRARLDAAG
jgi:hypothetical protein